MDQRMGRFSPSVLTSRSWIGPHSSMRSVANSTTWMNAPDALGGSHAGVIAARSASRRSGPSTWPWLSTACRTAKSSSSSGSPCKLMVQFASLGTARQSIIKRVMVVPSRCGWSGLVVRVERSRSGSVKPASNRYRHRVLSVQLLGGIAVERDGVPVPLSSLHLRLLAFLALHPGPHNRDALAARFWPDSPHPRASLRTAVWTLRQSLGPDVVVASRAAVALGPVVRDLDDPDRDGQLCPGLEDDWAETARAAHLRHRINCFDALIAAADDPPTAVALAARRCALTPLDEPAHRTLIERLAAAGDRAGALLAGRTLAARLRAELGVDLAPATTALLATLRAPASAPDHATGQRRPLFGRSREL